MANLDDPSPRRRRHRDVEDDDNLEYAEPPRRPRTRNESEGGGHPRRRPCDGSDVEPRQKRGPRTSRIYVHDDCDGETEISGDDFTRLANPFAWVSQTYCASCQKYAGLRKFCWADTDENLACYRRRLRRKAPLTLKLWCWLFGPVIGALLGMLVGILFTPNERMKGIIVGGFCGAVFFGFFLVHYLSRWFWQIDYRNKR